MAGLHFDITGDNSNFMNKLKQTENGIRQTSKKIEESGLGIEDMFGRISKAAAGLGAAFSAQQFASQVMKVRGEFQQLEVAFNTMLDSAEKSSELMQQLTRTAAITPFGLQDVAGGAKQLLAYGVASEKVNDTLIRLGDIAAGLSIPLNDLVYLYGTTMTQGQMFTQDLRQFQGRGIPLADELAKQFGVTKDKVGELVTAGKVGFEEMHQAIVAMTSDGGKFGGLMEAQSKTITGQISNIEDAIDSMFNEIGKSSEGAINTGLGAVSTLVENYEKVGEAIGVAVTAYGAYKAALMTGIALQKAEAAITAEAALQKTLAAMAGHTLTASQARGAAMSQLYAAAQKRVVASLKALTAATLTNPYVLAAAAITGAVYGLYKFATADSAAEKATKQFNNALEEQSKKHEEQKQKIDGLVSSLGNLELSEGTRIKNFQALKQEYPEMLKDINSENEFLREKHKILQLINQEQGKQKQADDVKLLEEAERKLNHFLEVRRRGTDTSLVDMDGNGWASDNVMDAIKAQQDIVNQLKARVATPEVESYLGNIKNLKDSDISATLEDITYQLQALENAGDNAIGYVTEIGKEFSKSQLKTLKSALEGEQKGRSGTKQSGSAWVAQYKKEYEAAQKAVTDFMKQKNELSELEFERQYKELTDKRDAAKKKYEDAGGSTKSGNKQLKNEEEKAKELLFIQRQNEQDRINLMKDGTEKRIAQIELDYKKEIDAYNEAKKKYGDTDEVKAMKETADATREKSLSDAYRVEFQYMQDYLKEYGTFQQQKLAIAQEYDAKIAASSNEWEKKSLENQKQSAIKQVDMKAIEQQIDWQGVFGNMTSVVSQQLESTLKALKEYTQSDKFKGSTEQDKALIYDAIDRLQRESTGGKGTLNLNKIQGMMDSLAISIQKVQYAQAAEIQAYRTLEKAQSNYDNALKSGNKSEIEGAKLKLDMAKNTAQVTSEAYAQATDDVKNFGNALNETGNATVGGLNQLQEGLQGLASGSLASAYEGLKNTMAGLNKLNIGGEVGKAISSLLSSLSNDGVIGQIISAILSILDILKEGIGTIISSLIDTILGAVNGILKNILSGQIFAQIGTSLYEGIGSILDTITFGGISSWFSSSNAKEVAETTERLTQRNEVLTMSIDALKDEIEKARGSESVKHYEEAVKKQEELIKNTGDVLAAQMGYHGAHHSNAYYIEEALTDSDWAEISKTVGEKVASTSDLWNLSPEDLKKVSTLTDIWDKIYNEGKYDKSEYLDAYLDLAGTLEELETGLKETLTQISFDSMYDSFIDTLMDMESTSEDFADSVSEYFMKAMLSNQIGKLYGDQLEKWYDKFAESMKSEGTLSDEEMAALRSEYDSIVAEAIAQRDAIAAATGYDSTSAYSQEASSKGYQAMSQETGEELSGRFTAFQISNEEIKNQMILVVTYLAGFNAILTDNNAVLNDILQQHAITNSYLEDIVKYTKPLLDFNTKMDALIDNTKNL